MTERGSYLTGQLLVAMPAMADPRFARAVVYVCSHTAEGAMGLVVNRLFGALSFRELLTQLGIETHAEPIEVPIFSGGPVEAGRGFVLHSTDFLREGTMAVSKKIALTGTLDILRAIAEGQGPEHALFALGYAGWGPGQLDAEMQDNGWLLAPADDEILFHVDPEHKWDRALSVIGIDPGKLSSLHGHA